MHIFTHEWGLIRKKTKGFLNKIRKTRNKYVHPSGTYRTNEANDAKNTLKWLFQVIKEEFGPGPDARYRLANGRLQFVKGIVRNQLA